MLETGLDIFLKKDHSRFRKARLGVLCNQASVTKNLVHISEALAKPSFKLDIACFLGPQHGIRGEKQDNMIESDDFVDRRSGLVVYSLYGATRVPTDAMLEKFDTFLVDLQDIGTRIYTFMYTLANCMRAAKRTGKKVVVLDRPNPINGVDVEGNTLEADFTSFVGQIPGMATRHGMTMGELAVMFNDEYEIGCDLEIIRLKGWKRTLFSDEWGRDWIHPSPNIPRLEAALTFPGTVHFEGTNISEGRGTTMPFEWIGAPYINDPDALAYRMNTKKIPGIYFRPCFFQPTYQKGKDQICGGVQMHITDRKKLKAFPAGLELLYEIYAEDHPQFKWKAPPYEYEHDRMPIDLIAGTAKLRETLERRETLKDFLKASAAQAQKFNKLRKKYLLYK
jgi:uncharacterized protein YbbC (DUF1343 family)